MPTLVGSAAAGLAVGLLYAASPLFLVTLAGAALLVVTAGRDLAPRERRHLVLILVAALGVRFLLIAAVIVSNLPYLSDLAVGGLQGDDAYYLARAIRARDIMLGITHGRYDYFVVSDEYGRTSYLQLLTALQTAFGPTPYSIRALNSLLFVTASYLLFTLCRPGFGATATSVGLIALLLLPSVMVSSTSTSKEPSYFFVTAVLLVAAVAIVRTPGLMRKAGAAVVLVVCLWILDDLRRGALVLGVAGLALAVIARVVLETPRRAIAAATVAVIAAGILWMQQPVRDRVLDATAAAAKLHAGHVFTLGHAYKLLDEGFYVHPGTPAAWPLELSELQAGRFVARAAISFLVTPLPWEMRSLSELVFFPEHLVWMLMVLLVPIGVVAGWRRDATVTACLIGFALPTAAAVAMTTGNVGTLLRLRGLVTPYLIWFGVLGGLTVCEWLLARTGVPALKRAEAAT